MEEVVEAAWNSSPIAFVIAKLNSCRRGIIAWAKEKNANSNLLISNTQTALETALSSASPDSAFIDSLTATLRKAYKEEEQFWLQRSRIQWLKQGDRNTGFYHAITRQRRMINSFAVIADNDCREVFEEHQIASVITEYFKDMFTTNGNSDFSALSSILSCRVTAAMNETLTALPSDSEIKQAALSINSGKAPDPDGFSAKFYHSYWHIISDDVTRDIKQFFSSDNLPAQQNETHIRLIPKVTGP